MQGPPPTFRQVFAAELPRLYAVAYHMCGTRSEAFDRLRELVALPQTAAVAAVPEAPRPADALLALLAHHIEDLLGRRAEKSFQILDNILRDDITHPIDINTRGIDGDFGRVHPLLWELKRTCLTSVLGCLPPGVRISFILADLLGYSPAASAGLLGINESAFRVRLTRARKRLDSYLAPLCQFVDRANACNCEGRLGVALSKEFINFPPHTDDIPQAPHDSGPEFQDMGPLYRALPTILLTEEQRESLLAACPEATSYEDIEEHVIDMDDLDDLPLRPNVQDTQPMPLRPNVQDTQPMPLRPNVQDTQPMPLRPNMQDTLPMHFAGPIEPDHPAGPDEPAQPDDPMVPGPEPLHVPSDPALHS